MRDSNDLRVFTHLMVASTHYSAPAISEESLSEDAKWIKSVSGMPRARLLLDHLAAFDATLCCGGVKGLEPPIEQTATWRRAFCHEYSKSDTPFNMISNTKGKLPKCIGICNLSGKHCMYYSESNTLAKVVCLSSQAVNPLIIDGINKVFEKAQELDASVLMTFCLPFQVGIERVHWEVRTIRKTAKGYVKDGELAFGSGDAEPRTVPCTKSIEHWTDALIADISKRLAAEATAVCLDRPDEDEEKKMSPVAMESMIAMLKTDRAKLIQSHKAEMEALKEAHKAEIDNLSDKVTQADEDASIRISKVVKQSKNVEESLKKKEEQVNAHNLTLREQLLSLQQAKDKAVADLNAANLSHKEQTNKTSAVQKTLDAQVASLKSTIAKSTAEWVRQRKELVDANAAKQKQMESKIDELTGSLKSTKSALKAVQAGAKEKLDQLVSLENKQRAENSTSNRMRTLLKMYKIVVTLAALRLDETTAKMSDNSLYFAKEEEKYQAAYKELEEKFHSQCKQKDAEVSKLKQELSGAESSLKKAMDSKKEETKPDPKVGDLEKKIKSQVQHGKRRAAVKSRREFPL